MLSLKRASMAAALLVAIGCRGDTDGALIDSAPGGLGDAVDMTGTQMNDREIVGAMVAANAAEITLSQVAVERATNPAVKSFAQMMITDHRAMNERIHALGRQLNVTSTASERTEDLADLADDAAEDLREQSGAEFDRAYMDKMVASHEETLEIVNRAVESTNTAQLDQALADARTKVQQHLQRAREIHGTLQQE